MSLIFNDLTLCLLYGHLDRRYSWDQDMAVIMGIYRCKRMRWTGINCIFLLLIVSLVQVLHLSKAEYRYSRVHWRGFRLYVLPVRFPKSPHLQLFKLSKYIPSPNSSKKRAGDFSRVPSKKKGKEKKVERKHLKDKRSFVRNLLAG